MGFRRFPSQTSELSVRTHLPRLSASVLGVEKGILLSALKNGFNMWRWQRNAKSEASKPWSRRRRWRWGQEKTQLGGLRTRRFFNPELLAYLGWEQQPQPWSVAMAMKYVGFPYFDRLWPPSSQEEHCKSKDAKYLHLEDVEVKWWFLTILRAISE